MSFRYIQKMIFRGLFFSLLAISLLITILFIIARPVYAQSAEDVVITEIMYSPLKGGDWIEIYNTSASSVDITGLKVTVGTTEYVVAVHDSNTAASLAAGAVAVIAGNSTAFIEHYAYTTPLYKISGPNASSFDLTGASANTVTLKKNADEIDRVTYGGNELTDATGASLHVTLGNIFTPAPATPGEIAINPVTEQVVRTVGSSVSTSVGRGSGEVVKDSDDSVYLGIGNTVTLYVLDQRSLNALTAKLLIGATEKTLTLSGTDVQKSGTYTVTETDPSGPVTYSVAGMKDTDGAAMTGTGTVKHNGKTVVIDMATPSVSVSVAPAGNANRKTVTVNVTEDSPPETVSYKVSSVSCGTSATYAASPETEQTAPLTDGTAEIRLFGASYNGKYICVKVTDKVGLVSHAVSDQISGITAASLLISEIMYAPEGGAAHEWIEVTNVGSVSVTLTDYKVNDGGTKRSITHISGAATISPNGVAVIAKKPTEFKTDYRSYTGSLFRASISLLDSKDTLGLEITGTAVSVDSASYIKADGAYRNGRSLHITNSGILFEATPTPGKRTTGQALTDSALGSQTPVYPTDSLAKVSSFNGSAPSVSGQNLFFTKDDSVDVVFTLSDDVTQYTTSNYGGYLTLKSSASTVNTYRVTEKSAVNGTETGTVVVTYTVYFSETDQETASDNRVTVYPRLKDENDNYNTKRAAVVVVRNTTAPTLAMSGSASVLGFYDGSNVIVPVNFTDISSGDWLTLTYGGSCSDSLLSYIARNGVQGLYYDLDDGTYTGCTVTGTDSSGNASNVLSLPKIIVGSGR